MANITRLVNYAKPLRSGIKSTVFANFVSLASIQGVNYILPLIVIPYLFRILGVKEFGLFGFAYAFVQYFVIMTDFGFNLSATKYIAEHRDDPQKINEYLNAATLARLLICAVGFVVMAIITFSFNPFKADKAFFLLFYGIVLGGAIFPQWFFQGIEKMKYITVITIVAKIISIIPIFFLVRSSADYLRIPILYSIGFLIAGGFSLYFIYCKMGMKWFFPDSGKIMWSLKNSWPYFLSRAAVSMFTVSNVFILGLTVNVTAVGYYSAAEKIYQALNSAYYPLSGAIFPHMAKKKDVSFFKKVFTISMLANAIIVCFILVFAPEIIRILFHTHEIYSVLVLRILAVVCFFTVPSILLGYPFLAAMGHPNYTNGTVIGSAIFHIAGLLILFSLGAITIYSIAWMVVITEIILFFMRVYGVRKYRLI